MTNDIAVMGGSKNDPKTAERCRAPDVPKVIYPIKVSAQFNSDCAVMLRDGMRRKSRFYLKIRFIRQPR